MMKKILSIVFLAVFLSSASAGEPLSIRVAILKDKDNVLIGVSGPFDIVDLKKNKVLFSGRDMSSAGVCAVKEGIKIKDSVYAAEAILIAPKKKISVVVDKRRYRGNVSIFKDSLGKLTVVNKLDLESYIKGVLYHEISHKWPMDAIKAQAVAVRTYAMYQKEVMKNKNYDVTADTSSQVYGGYLSEQTKTNRGVSLTQGEVLLYKNKLFPAYFHATCGGVTENASELWNINIEPLRGGRVCGFCTKSPHYHWKAQMSLKDLSSRLCGKYGFEGEIADISIAERNPTGRVRTIAFKDSLDRSYQVSAKDFRFLIGPDTLRSTNFSISLDGGHVVFTGKGWGHGVGLCQWGAYGMSKQGFGYEEILNIYYPGAKIVHLS